MYSCVCVSVLFLSFLSRILVHLPIFQLAVCAADCVCVNQTQYNNPNSSFLISNRAPAHYVTWILLFSCICCFQQKLFFRNITANRIPRKEFRFCDFVLELRVLFLSLCLLRFSRRMEVSLIFSVSIFRFTKILITARLVLFRINSIDFG